MPRTCTVCHHASVHTINTRLLAGSSTVALGNEYRLSHDALQRHRKRHLTGPMLAAAEAAIASLPESEETRLAKAQQAIEVAHGSDLLAQLNGLVATADRICVDAEHSGERRIALHALRELRELVALAGKLRGELDSSPNLQINIGRGDGVPKLQKDGNGAPILPPGIRPWIMAWVDFVMEECQDPNTEREERNKRHERFDADTEGFTPGDYESLFKWCTERRARVIDAF